MSKLISCVWRGFVLFGVYVILFKVKNKFGPKNSYMTIEGREQAVPLILLLKNNPALT